MASLLPKKSGRTLRTFPRALEIRTKEENEMMKNLKQLFLAVAFVVAVSMTASAQKEGDKQTPPKEGKPPVIVVAPEKKPKDDKPKGDDKKPQFMMYKSKYTISLVQDK